MRKKFMLFCELFSKMFKHPNFVKCQRSFPTKVKKGNISKNCFINRIGLLCVLQNRCLRASLDPVKMRDCKNPQGICLTFFINWFFTQTIFLIFKNLGLDISSHCSLRSRLSRFYFNWINYSCTYWTCSCVFSWNYACWKFQGSRGWSFFKMDVADVADREEVAKPEEADILVIRQKLEDAMARLVCLAF